MFFSRLLLHGSAVLCFGIFLICPVFARADTHPEPVVRTLEKLNEKVNIKVSWPVTGISRIDEESEGFVRGVVAEFEKEAEELAALWEQERGKETAEIFVPRELSVTYELTRPTQTVESILWTVWSYMGGAHGQLSLVAHNYEVETGYPVLLEDLFLDPERAILEFARISRQRLGAESNPEEEAIPDDMLQAGTEPVESNFQIFVLLSDGLRIHFPPYQVAPWAMGPQSVDITLKELNMAKPDMKFWTPITN